MPQADKKPPVNKVNTEHITDFSGGLNTTISGSLLQSKEAQVAKDISFEQKGTIVPRKGRRKRYTTPFSDKPILGLGQLYKQDGTARLVIASDTNMYSDKPNLINKWTTKSEFEADGTTSTKYIDTTSDEYSMSLYRNYIPRIVADCADADLFVKTDSTLTVDTGIHKFNGQSIKIAINADKTVGYAKIAVSVDKAKPWVFSAYLRNGNATSGIRLIASKLDGEVIKSTSYVTATSFTKSTLKLSKDDVKDLYTIGIEVKGEATHYAYMDGLVLRPITQDDYDNGSYNAPEFPDVEPLNTSFNVNWNDGTKTDVVVVESSISCAIGSSLNNTQDLEQGEHTDTKIIDSKLTVDTNLTWTPYEDMTFDELIAL